MKFLERLKSRPAIRQKKSDPEAVIYRTHVQVLDENNLNPSLPENVLGNIFLYVCPHSADLGYDSWDDTIGNEYDCRLCSTRDLANCIQVCKLWRAVGERLLYQSVRMDISHFCNLQSQSDHKPNHRRSFLRSSSSENIDPVQHRLQLFTRTQRENHNLGALTKCLKVPWMIRETSRADLSRVISVLPNLEYIDLPTGEYENSSSDTILNEELLHRCPKLRKMRYNKGSIKSFRTLIHTPSPWPYLEILELNGLNLEPDRFSTVLALFPSLKELRLINIEGLGDTFLSNGEHCHLFPNLTTLSIEGKTDVTLDTLMDYLSLPSTQDALLSLTLIDTDIPFAGLHRILSAAKHLQQLWYHNDIEKGLATSSIPLLRSSTLETLHLELLPQSSSAAHISESYCSYLSKSILCGSLPSLRTVFAFHSSLPDSLLQPTITSNHTNSRLSTYSAVSSTSSASNRSNLAGDFIHNLKGSLVLYTKPATAPEQEWSVTTIEPPNESNGSLGSMSATRPISMLLQDSGSQKSRSSSFTPSSHLGGGFLAIPASPEGNSDSKKNNKGEWKKSLRSANLGPEWMGADY